MVGQKFSQVREPESWSGGSYDLLLASSSWDGRSAALTAMKIDHLSKVVLLDYSNRGDDGSGGAVSEAISEFAIKVEADVQLLEIDDSHDIRRVWQRVRETIIAEFRDLGRPLKLLVDLVGISRYVSLGLLGWGLRSGVINSIDFAYAFAVNYETKVGEISFRQGDWRVLSVPGSGGPAQAGAANHLVVLAGFETSKTRRLVHVMEPDSFSVVVARGYSDAHDERLRIALPDLLQNASPMFATPTFTSMEDLSQSVDELRVHVEQVRAKYGLQEKIVDISILLAGPRTLSLAACIVALDLEVTNLFYVSADAYSEVLVRDWDKFTRFEVKG